MEVLGGRQQLTTMLMVLIAPDLPTMAIVLSCSHQLAVEVEWL